MLFSPQYCVETSSQDFLAPGSGEEQVEPNGCDGVLRFSRVDVFIPGVEKVGGFSMCSSPGLLQREGVIELAVKYSTHPPAHWVHTKVTLPL